LAAPGDRRLIAGFLEMMSAERGASANTLAAYARDLELYAAFVAGRGERLDGAGSEHIRAWLEAMHGEGLAKSSIARRLSAVRQLHKFAYAEGAAADDPATTISAPQRDAGLPKVLSVGQVDRLLVCVRERAAGARGKARVKAVRMACLIEVLYATGLRVSELVSLTVGQVSGDDRFISVRGKGGRELLGATLAGRGAEVTYAEVYERRPTAPSRESVEQLETAWRQGGIDAYTATSSELLEALVGIVTPRCRELMDSTALLTGASRVAERAAKLGLGSPVVLAAGPDDESLVEALIRWHAARERLRQS